MNDVIRYKGYYTKVQVDLEEDILWGKVEGIDDLIIFECHTPAEVEAAFHEAVDEYLDFCAETGKNPQKAYSGSFNVRIGAELHRELAEYADEAGVSINAALTQMISGYLHTALV